MSVCILILRITSSHPGTVFVLEYVDNPDVALSAVVKCQRELKSGTFIQKDLRGDHSSVQ
ncbi:hypothetical protein MAR_034876 [Mya arenaria]|uniref:Uncharacterized protein n=1 Tax=Mya arenaria TaxID=6604 RepID=A0ABY7EII3_MYAAR|nr:hypothetical protein MAR_034876 [Mya arenaria]